MPREFHQILVVGHYSHDTLVVSDDEICYRLGGPPAYISSILHALDADYSVVAKVGQDFRYSDEVRKEPIVVPGARTTTCLNDYSRGERQQSMLTVCDPIYPDDIKANAKVCLACGMIGEIMPGTIQKLRRVSEVLIGDLQGFLRLVQEDRTVSLATLSETMYADSIEQFDFLKASQDELEQVELEYLRKHTSVIVTHCEKGCTIYEKEGEVYISGFAVPVEDATGAGDCFLAGFGYALSRGLNMREAARMGNYCGALAVQYIGMPNLGKEEVCRMTEAFIDVPCGSNA